MNIFGRKSPIVRLVNTLTEDFQIVLSAAQAAKLATMVNLNVPPGTINTGEDVDRCWNDRLRQLEIEARRKPMHAHSELQHADDPLVAELEHWATAMRQGDQSILNELRRRGFVVAS